MSAEPGLLVSTLRTSAPMAPEARPEDTAPQIVQAIRLAWSRGAGEAHIRLDPAQFGELSVSMRVENGQVVARLQAESPAVREWLQANRQLLQDSLAAQDLRLDRFDVTPPGEEFRDAADREERRQYEAAAGKPRRPRRTETGAGFEVVA
jgi:flagellar hook-length control protein FliK